MIKIYCKMNDRVDDSNYCKNDQDLFKMNDKVDDSNYCEMNDQDLLKIND